ncbi:MAG: DUF58 domain-containing protein [Planctomycetes bacterium]|nr:DUF58 domain-containing protein [Planctomycetota bacterium]
MARALDPELLAEARRIQVRADRMVTDVMSGGYSSVFRGSGIEFDEVREFAEGDELRSVDWNVTARVGRPFVKKFVEERELTVLFLLDASASMAFGTRPEGEVRRDVASTAALFVGCVAFAAARNNDKAGLITFTDHIERYVPAKKGRNHVLRLIREACEPPQDAAATNFAQALDYAARVQRRRAIVFVVSDFLSSDPVGGLEIPDCRKHLRLLAQRHDVIAVRIRDPLAAGLDRAAGDVAQLPKAGLLHLADPETGRTVVVDTSSARVRREVQQRWRDERQQWLELCRSSKVDLLDVPTEGSVADPIVRFFRMRERRGAKR